MKKTNNKTLKTAAILSTAQVISAISSASAVEYTVQKGDIFTDIIQEHSRSSSELAYSQMLALVLKLNSKVTISDYDSLNIGEIIKLPNLDEEKKYIEAYRNKYPEYWNPYEWKVSAENKYVVVEGDTLGKIALDKITNLPLMGNKGSISLLLKINPTIKNRDKIFTGQEIVIPTIQQISDFISLPVALNDAAGAQKIGNADKINDLDVEHSMESNESIDESVKVDKNDKAEKSSLMTGSVDQPNKKHNDLSTNKREISSVEGTMEVDETTAEEPTAKGDASAENKKMKTLKDSVDEKSNNIDNDKSEKIIEDQEVKGDDALYDGNTVQFNDKSALNRYYIENSDSLFLQLCPPDITKSNGSRIQQKCFNMLNEKLLVATTRPKIMESLKDLLDFSREYSLEDFEDYYLKLITSFVKSDKDNEYDFLHSLKSYFNMNYRSSNIA